MFWFDLDNSPHVPLFKPIFNEFDKSSIQFVVTARDFAQTIELLELYNIRHTVIGEHGGKSKFRKLLNLYDRSKKLKDFVKNYSSKISLAVSHGSRSQLVTSKWLGIKSLLMFDYEYTESKIFNYFSTFMLCPKFIPDKRLKDAGFNLNKIIRYNGFKEELYLSNFIPQNNIRKILDISEEDILIIIRPPSMVGNYHDTKSEKILTSLISILKDQDNIEVIIVNRTRVEKEFIDKIKGSAKNIKYLNKVVDGLQLIYAADIVFSGGGTMNREAALLGVETYSFFTGRRPYLDEYLSSLGRLTFIENEKDLEKIDFVKKPKKNVIKTSDNLIEEIKSILIDLARK